MPEQIGNIGTRAVAWAEHIMLSVRPRATRDKEPEKLAERALSTFGPAEPLEATGRRLMEQFLGYDFDKVRVHRGPGAEEVSRQLGARAFTFRGHIFAPKENLDTSTTVGLGLLAHELTHAVQQTQPSRRPQGEALSRDAGEMPVTAEGSRSDVEMVLLAPAQSVAPANGEGREAQAEASERLVGEALSNEQKPPPVIDPEAVADRVYYLMQHDLALERERATGWG